MKIALIKNLAGQFVPAFDSDHETAKRIKFNKVYEFEYKQPRNYMFHRKFMALINLCYQNQEVYNNIDDMRYDLTIEAGYFRTAVNMHGEEVKKALSIKFASMDEVEFGALYSAVLLAIVNWLGIDKQDIIDNVQQYF